MHIAYVVTKGMPLGGGIEKYTEELGSRLVKRGHSVTVFTMNHYGVTGSIYRDMKIKTVPTIKHKVIEKIVATGIASLGSCSSTYDLVHFHAFGPALWCFLPRIVGRKVITQGHGLEWKRSRWGFFGRNFLKFSEWPSVKFPNAVTVVSRVQQNYLRERYGIESTYIPTGVVEPVREPPRMIKEIGLEKDNYILFAARLVQEKGAHYVLDAYRTLDSDKKLVIAGDAPYEETYKNKLRRLAGDDPRILFPGFVTGKKLKELFSNCYLFVQPSELEGLPIGLLQAMSHGNCCLVSDIEENKEALNGYGFTFKSRNVDDLKKQLATLLNDENMVNRYKGEAREFVLKHHNWDLITNQFEAFYRKVLES